MDRDIFRLIILIIGLLVMAGLYYFDPGRRQKSDRQKPWYAEGEDSSEFSDTDADEYVRVVKNDDYSFDEKYRYEEQKFEKQQEQRIKRKSGQYSSISELVTQAKPVATTGLKPEPQPEPEEVEPDPEIVLKPVSLEPEAFEFDVDQQLESESTAESFANNSLVISDDNNADDQLFSEFDEIDVLSKQQRRFSDSQPDEEFFSPLSKDWAENIDSELEISAALLEPLDDPDPNPEITDDTTKNERPTILMLYLVNTGDKQYQGEDISKAFEKAGLRHGSMDLFHYVDYQENKELFSVSNMQEPGTFPEQMTYLETEGIILFMQPMTLSNPAETYEKMIACADTLYTELGGNILDEKRQPVTQAYLDQQRQWLAS
ncbi:MAG: cell division protein ZipA C-terminal FtsZ-binding domain-containing protein [Methylococcales bacterium]